MASFGRGALSLAAPPHFFAVGGTAAMRRHGAVGVVNRLEFWASASTLRAIQAAQLHANANKRNMIGETHGRKD